MNTEEYKIKYSLFENKNDNNHLLKFKNIHYNKLGVICGPGPSLRSYIDNKLNDVILVGSNSVGLFTDEINIDYLFVIDKMFTVEYKTNSKFYTVPKNIDTLDKDSCWFDIVKENMLKSNGKLCLGRHSNVYRLSPYKEIEQYKNNNKVIPFLYNDCFMDNECRVNNKTIFYNFNKDISKYFGCVCISVIFLSIQFLLYSGVDRILFTGIDSVPIDTYKLGWEKLEKFIKNEYPNVKIYQLDTCKWKIPFAEQISISNLSDI